MKSHAFKVGPAHVESVGSALVHSIRQHLILLIFIPIFVPLFWLTHLQARGRISFLDFLLQKPVLISICAYMIFFFVVAMYRAFFYEINLWFEFKEDHVVFFRKPSGEVWKKVPYRHATIVAFSENRQNYLRYKKNGVGIMGLDSLVRLGIKTKEEREEILRLLKEKCPRIEVWRTTKWGDIKKDS